MALARIPATPAAVKVPARPRTLIAGIALVAVASGWVLNPEPAHHPGPPLPPPAFPADLSAALAAFPADTAEVFARPVSVIARRLSEPIDNGDAAIVLPAGLTRAAIAAHASLMVSAVYRTPDPSPAVHVHVLSTVDAEGAAAVLSRMLTVDHDGETQVRAGAGIVAIVHAPEAADRPLAARLVASLGRSYGLLGEEDLRAMFAVLPEQLPAGFAVDTLAALNINKMPEWAEASIAAVLGENDRRLLAQTRGVIPERLTSVGYRDSNGRRVQLVIGDYLGSTAAHLSWMLLRFRLRGESTRAVEIDGAAAGLTVAGGPARLLLVREGSFVALVRGQATTGGETLTAFAASLRLTAQANEPAK